MFLYKVSLLTDTDIEERQWEDTGREPSASQGTPEASLSLDQILPPSP